ncbi:MAG TPA: DNA polymerase III subunit delta' [Beijerinckiaceae bacterium]|nr:DNA polymerase III subunit delta' [Beijerinckiaceae bacterium]
MARKPSLEASPESDRFEEAPHPRDARALFGHAEAERQLLDAYRSGRLPQAWIIGGREGVGKATLAWRFARFLFVHPDPRASLVQAAGDLSVPFDHPAVRRVSSLSHGDLALLRRQWNEKTKKHFTEIRVDDVRDALGLFHHASGEGGWRICVIDCAEDLNRSSANALLKIIEEPPPRSLFLMAAHRPAHVLATVRSRSRMLLLEPLAREDVASAVSSLGTPWTDRPRAEIEAAATRSGGSVREALRLLDGQGLQLTNRIEGMLGRLPRLDWGSVQVLADGVSTRENEQGFETLLATVYDWLDARVRGGGEPRQLAPFADAWERIAEAAREVEALNLDRRPFVLTIFEELAGAVETAGRR